MPVRVLSAELRNNPDALVSEAVKANVRALGDHLRHGSEILEELIGSDGLRIIGAEYAFENRAGGVP